MKIQIILKTKIQFEKLLIDQTQFFKKSLLMQDLSLKQIQVMYIVLFST